MPVMVGMTATKFQPHAPQRFLAPDDNYQISSIFHVDQSIVSSIFSSRAEPGRYNVETRKENMHEHTGASHAAAFCLDEENNTSTTHLEDISKKTKNCISAFKKSLCTVQYACVHARSTGSADQLFTSFKNHCATRVV